MKNWLNRKSTWGLISGAIVTGLTTWQITGDVVTSICAALIPVAAALGWQAKR
jgi:dolichol kinase